LVTVGGGAASACNDMPSQAANVRIVARISAIPLRCYGDIEWRQDSRSETTMPFEIQDAIDVLSAGLPW